MVIDGKLECSLHTVCCTGIRFTDLLISSWTAARVCRTKRWQDHPIQGFGKRNLVTRLATQADAYPVADCHVSVFNPKTLLKPFLIVDRVLALLVRYIIYFCTIVKFRAASCRNMIIFSLVGPALCCCAHFLDGTYVSQILLFPQPGTFVGVHDATGMLARNSIKSL